MPTRRLRSLALCAAAAATLGSTEAWPCSLIGRPYGMELLSSGTISPRSGDAGADGQAPSKPALTNPRVSLYHGPCDGRGAACPELDWLEVEVSASDDRTSTRELRYVAYFGGTANDASAQPQPELLFEADGNDERRISAWLGLNRQRRGTGFERQALCFTIAAVDNAGNVGPRSDPLCLDTTDEKAATTVMVQGHACQQPGVGCASTPGLLPFALGLLLFLRRRSASAQTVRLR